MTPFRIPNFWQQQNPKARILPIVSLQFHPKDIGTLLIGYSDGAVLYSFKQNKPTKFFLYEVPRGAPGGDGNPASVGTPSHPKLTHALWHPTGTFVLTAHDDSSLVIWDPRDGRLVTARSIQDIDVNIPSSRPMSPGGTSLTVKEPYSCISWCSKENPDDTGLLIAGGTPTADTTKGLTWIELGPTPNYQTSSWDVLANHFRSPRRVSLLPTPPTAEITNFLLVPRSSPHYAGSHDPIAVLATLSSGELITLSFPSGHAITPTNQLHVSLTYVHPFITKFAIADVDRTRWLGMREARQHGPNFLVGGAEATKSMKRFEGRNIVQMVHADGTIRIWDAGHGDEIENSVVLQADLARALGRWDNIAVTKMSMSGATTEMSVGLVSGEILVFRYGKNPNAGRPPFSAGANEGPGRMTDISKRSDPGLKEGFLPLPLTNDQQGPVTALKNSDVGFVAAGYDSGGVTVIDLRGPAIIHTALLSDLTAKHKKVAIRGRSNSIGQQKEWATALEFGVMTLEGDGKLSMPIAIAY
jgi:syntaxin-binding protein 5